ncbi:MAG: WD40/YVTN/BNR-like repeat-containing protein, partial [bacterium]
WNAPLIISPHQPQTIYYGGNRLFKSVDRGDTWTVLGPDLTRRTPNSKILGNTLATIAESPMRPGLIYGGTDDGKLWVTRDDGKTWTDLSEKVPGLPPQRWITRVEPSHFDSATVYVTISRTRNDDDSVYVFRSADFGATWSSITKGLPSKGQAHVIRESSRSRDLLFLGTDQGLFASTNRGADWHKLRQVPTAPVMDLLIHPRDRELIVATHGRSLYVVDIAPLEEAAAAGMPTGTTLFTVRPAIATEQVRTQAAPASIVGQNPPFGAVIYYYLSDAAKESPRVLIRDAAGKQVAALEGARDAGLRRVVWNLRERAGGSLVKPGEYSAVLIVGGNEYVQKIKVAAAVSDG